jgi:hypothetical protein
MCPAVKNIIILYYFTRCPSEYLLKKITSTSRKSLSNSLHILAAAINCYFHNNRLHYLTFCSVGLNKSTGFNNRWHFRDVLWIFKLQITFSRSLTSPSTLLSLWSSCKRTWNMCPVLESSNVKNLEFDLF